jgi:hypothetical protein
MPGDQLQGTVQVFDEHSSPRLIEISGWHTETKLDACHSIF